MNPQQLLSFLQYRLFANRYYESANNYSRLDFQLLAQPFLLHRRWIGSWHVHFLLYVLTCPKNLTQSMNANLSQKSYVGYPQMLETHHPLLHDYVDHYHLNQQKAVSKHQPHAFARQPLQCVPPQI